MHSDRACCHNVEDGQKGKQDAQIIFWKFPYMEFGDSTGHPVFYAHGGPGSRLEGKLFHEEALHRRYKFITTDRPGMGGSTYLSNRKLLDYPLDIAELARLRT